MKTNLNAHSSSFSAAAAAAAACGGRAFVSISSVNFETQTTK
jgi:hypothetical protein